VAERSGTDQPELAREARNLRVESHSGADSHPVGNSHLGADSRIEAPFHFGERLAGVVERFRLERVLCMGGAAAPLIGPAELERIVNPLREGDRVAVLNNVKSPDLIGFTRARELTGWLRRGAAEEGFSPEAAAGGNVPTTAAGGALPATMAGENLAATDNALAFILGDAGYEKIVMAGSPVLAFDLDTPADFLILERQSGAGPRTRTALAALDWDRGR